MIISIEGNIGSGKSTFIKYLQWHFRHQKNVIVLQEPVGEWEKIKDSEGNSYLQKFYQNPKKYAFSFQMMAYITRINQLREAYKSNSGGIIITERCNWTDKNVFAKMLRDIGDIEDVEYEIYNKWFDYFVNDFKIDKFVYLQTTPQVCKKRILKRNRQGEEIDLDYLRQINEYHENWLNNQKDKLTYLVGDEEKEDNYQSYQDWIIAIQDIIEGMDNYCGE